MSKTQSLAYDQGILVFPDHFVSSGSDREYQRFTLPEAMKTEFQVEAHFCCYTGFKRRKKEHADEVLVKYAAIDIDRVVNENTPQGTPKTGWANGQEAYEALGLALERLSSVLGFCPDVMYSTPNGLRAVWSYSRLLKPSEAAATVVWLIEQTDATLREIGLFPDPACKDWTRNFRTPYCVREGKGPLRETGVVHVIPSQDYGRLEPQTPMGEVALEVRPATSLPKGPLAPIEFGDEEELWLQVWGPTSENQVPISAAAQEVLNRVLNKTHKGVLTGEIACGTTAQAQLVKFGGRDDAVVRLAGSVVQASIGVPDVTPDLLLGLMGRFLRSLEPGGAEDADWWSKAKAKIREFWSKDHIPSELSRALSEESSHDYRLVEFPVVNTIRAWFKACGRRITVKEACEFYLKRCVSVNEDSKLCVWQPNGEMEMFSFATGVANICGSQSRHPLRPHVEQLLTMATDKGVVPAKPSTFQGPHLSTRNRTREVRMSPAKFLQGVEAFEVYNSWKFSCPLYVIDPELEPTYNADLEKFLHNALGDSFNQFHYYVSCFVDPQLAVPLVVMHGPAQCGKSYISSSLCSLFGPQYSKPAANQEASRFNALAELSPCVSYEEGFPRGFNSLKVRDMVNTGGTITIEAKGQDAYVVGANYRPIKTTNNLFQDLRAMADSGAPGVRIDRKSLKAVAARVLILGIEPKLFDPRSLFPDPGAGRKAMCEHLLWMALHKPVDPATVAAAQVTSFGVLPRFQALAYERMDNLPEAVSPRQNADSDTLATAFVQTAIHQAATIEPLSLEACGRGYIYPNPVKDQIQVIGRNLYIPEKQISTLCDSVIAVSELSTSAVHLRRYVTSYAGVRSSVKNNPFRHALGGYFLVIDLISAYDANFIAIDRLPSFLHNQIDL